MSRTKRYVPEFAKSKTYGRRADGTETLYRIRRPENRDRWLHGRDKHWPTHQPLEDDWDGPLLRAKNPRKPSIRDDFDDV